MTTMVFQVVVLAALFFVDSTLCFVPSPDAATGTRRARVDNKFQRTQNLEYMTQQESFADVKTSHFEASNFADVKPTKSGFEASNMKSWEASIFAAEMDLKQAMLRGDVGALELLLDDEMIFVNHLDQVMTKQDDLESHRCRIVELDTISLANWNIEVVAVNGRPHLALVTVDAHIRGALGGFFFEEDLRFHRVWKRKAGRFWQVSEGDSSIVLKD
jgi:hypothetical protein